MEAGETPDPFPPASDARYESQLEASEDGRRLEYKRSFSFAGLDLPASSYPVVKGVFEAVHQRDAHTVVLKLEQQSDLRRPEGKE